MFSIEPKSNIPIYIQIISNVKEYIMQGKFKPGEKILSQREMAKTLPVNPNTVAKAYQELERQKVIETIRGRGTFIFQNYNPKTDEENLEKLSNKIRDIVIDMYYMGITRKQIIEKIDENINKVERQYGNK